MNKLSQKVEFAANILIIAVAVLLGSIVVKQYFFDKPAVSNQPERLQPVIGSKIDLPDVNWANQPKTIILALNKGCRFCTESASFYQRLIKDAQSKNIKLVAVLPSEKGESASYLNGLGITNLEVKQSTLDNLRVSGTPTLIIANEKGEVANFWVGS